MAKPRRASYAVTSAELPVLKTLGLEEVDPEDVFELQRKEGAGAFGRVFRACYKDDHSRLAALKVIPVALEAGERGEDIESVRREIQFLRECDHPNVVAFHGAYYKDGALWVAMEHCAGGSVGDIRRVRALSEREISVIMRGALRGLAYLHSRRKIHRDVKGGNILLTGAGQVKIADFGVSAQLRDTLSRRGSFVGTPYWMSPELIQDSDYDFKADIWSLGITAIELADQKPPLFDEHPMRVLIQIPRNPPPQVAHPEKWSAAFLGFLRFCLRKDPAERPTALECMQHEFIRRDAHIERVFADGERGEGATTGGLQVDNLAARAAQGGGEAAKAGAVAEATPAAAAAAIEQELDQEIAEEIGGDDSADAALSEASVSSQSDAEGEGEASTELLCETFEFRDAAQSPQAGASSPASPPLNAADDLLNLSADELFAPVDDKPAHDGQEAAARTSPQHMQSASATSFRQPPTEFKLLPSSAKSPVLRSSRDSSARFVKLSEPSRTSSGGAFNSLSFASNTLAQKPPRPSPPAASLRPKASLSPPPSPPVKASWLSVSASQDDPLASIDTVTSARVNRLLSSFSASSSSPSLAAAMRAYNDQYAADAPSRAARQSFNWRSVEAALPPANPPTSASPRDDATASGKIFVGDPFRASHDVCVKYNSIQAQYEGVPLSAEWAALHQQFGIALSHMRCRSSTPPDARPDDHVPALVRMLRRELVRHGGLRCKYVYRVSPVQEEVQRAEAAINRGSFAPAQVADPHVYASLLKLWLRELPALLLDALDVQDLVDVAKVANAAAAARCEDDDDLQLVTAANIDVVDAQITRTLRKLGGRETAVLQWLLEHMLEVSAHRASNLMTTHALATVLAPNLFSGSGVARSSQEKAGNLMRQVVLFLRVLLSWRRAGLTAPTLLLEHEVKHVAAAFIEAPASSNKPSALHQRVRQSLTKIVEPSEADDEHKASLEAILRRRVDRLWSDLANSEAATADTQRQENVLRRVFAAFQQSMLELVAAHAKESDARAWATDLAVKLAEGQQLETLAMPEPLARMQAWVAGALTFEAFCRLLDREQTVQDKLEKMQTRLGGASGDNQRAADDALARSLLRHVSRRQREAEASTVGHSNQSEEASASKTDELLRSGAARLATVSKPVSSDAHGLHRNMVTLGQRQPAIGNLLALLGARSESRPRTGAQGLAWLQEQLLEAIPRTTAL
jgi:hypothetical protein